MADQDKIPTRYQYRFINNVFGSFAKDILDWFANSVFPEYEWWKVVGTYDKAVQYIAQNSQYGRETDMPMKPALILNPSGDFDFEETSGRQLWRFPNLAPGLISRIFEPIYQDQNVMINVGFSRLKGELELMALVTSFYQYYDVKMYLGLLFGGKDRYIYPQWFNSFVIIPPEISNYQYSNPYTGVSYTLNIPDTSTKLIKSTNTTEVIYPCRILPRFKLTGISDGSSRLGGTDKLPEWRLNFTIEYEIEVPSFLILETDYIVKDLKVNIKYGSCYSANSLYNTDQIPQEITSFTDEMIYSDATSGETLELDSTTPVIINQVTETGTIKKERNLEFKTRYFHIVTKDEEESTTTIEFALPEVILNPECLIINSKGGTLMYGDNYLISLDGETLTINKVYVTLLEGDILELFVYKVV
jgi:hypothetical protein